MQMLNYHIQSALLSLVSQLRYQLFERQFRYTLQVGLVVSTLLFATLAAVLVSHRSPLPSIAGLAIIGLGVGITAFTLMYNYIERSLILLFASTVLLFFSFGPSITPTFLLALAIIAIWLIKLLLGERSLRSLKPMLVNRTAVLFMIAATISFVWSSIYVDPLVRPLQDDKLMVRLTTLLVLLISPMIMLMFAHVLRSLKTINWLIMGYLAINVGLLLFRALNLPAPKILSMSGQWMAWTGIFAISLLLFDDSIGRRQRIFLVVAIGLALFIAFVKAATWASGWVPLSVGLVVCTVIRTRWSIPLFILAFLALILLRGDVLSQTLEAENAESGQSRLIAGMEAINIGNEHFLFGTGPAGYHFYLTYRHNWFFQLSHNNYVDIYAQTGIVGFTTWLIMWASIGWPVMRNLSLTRSRGRERALAVAFVACYVTTLASGMLGDWITPFPYTQSIGGVPYTLQHWMFAGMGLAFYHLMKSKHAQSSAHEV